MTRPSSRTTTSGATTRRLRVTTSMFGCPVGKVSAKDVQRSPIKLASPIRLPQLGPGVSQVVEGGGLHGLEPVGESGQLEQPLPWRPLRGRLTPLSAECGCPLQPLSGRFIKVGDSGPGSGGDVGVALDVGAEADAPHSLGVTGASSVLQSGDPYRLRGPSRLAALISVCAV